MANKFRNAVTRISKAAIILAAVFILVSPTLADNDFKFYENPPLPEPPQTISGSVNVPCTSNLNLGLLQAPVTDFFINLNCTVSTVTVSGAFTDGTEMTLTLTQDGVGGHPFPFPANFLNLPVLATTANGTTVVTFQFCGVVGKGAACPANSWQNTDVGPAGAAYLGSPTTVIDAALFGVTPAVCRVSDATVSTTNATVTLPNNDCTFTAIQNGLKCFAVVGGTSVFGTNTTQTWTTLTSNSGNCGSTNSSANATASAAFFLGADSTTGFQNATAALYAIPYCGNMTLPNGDLLLLQAINPAPSTAGTGCAQAGYNRERGGVVTGQRRQGTRIIPGPGFNFTSPNGTNTSCFWTGNGFGLEGFSIDGMGQSLSGISTAPCSPLVSIGPVTTQGGDLFLVDWAFSASNNPQGLALQGQSFSFPNINVFNFGHGGVSCGSNVILLGMYSSNASSGGGISVGGGGWCYDIGGAYNTNVSNIDSIQVLSGGTFQGFGSYTQDSGASNEDSANVTGNFICDWCQFPGIAAVQATKVGIKINSGGVLDLHGTDISGGSTGGALLSVTAGAGTVFNRGKNTSHSGPFLFTGNYVDLTGTWPTSGCSGVATSSSNIAIKISGVTVAGAGVPSTCTGTTVDAGIEMKTSGTIFELLVSVSATGSTAGSGVFSVTKNGVNQTMTCTIGNVNTSCQDGATAHQVTYVKGDLISIALFPTGAAETLSTPKVDLIAW